MRGWFFTTIYKTIYTHKNILEIIFVSLFLTNCNYKNLKIDPQANSGANTNLSAEALITDELIMSYSLQSCQKCHAGAKQPTLDSVANVKANITKVLSEVTSGDMPPPEEPTKLTDCQKALVKNWAEGTSKVVSEVVECKSVASPVVVPTLPIIPIELMPLNFQTLKTKIIEPKCLHCHNPKGEDWEAALVSFETYADLTSGEYAKYWKAPAADSKVFEEITYNHETEDDGMPPKDSKTARVTKEETDFIVRWIDAGKPE
jgi:hypothetical protein